MKKEILWVFLFICMTANAANVKDQSNLELFGQITSYLSDLKNKQNIKEESDLYEASFEEIETRIKNGNPSAPLYKGILTIGICQKAKELDVNTTYLPACVDAFRNFGITANTQKTVFPHERALALSYRGETYRNGYGVEKSNLLAANSYAESAYIYMKSNDKEKALIALEKALQIYPEHPKAKKLLNEILSK